MISFFLTTQCNLACTYCYAIRRRVEPRAEVLNVEFAKVGIEDFFRSESSRHIRFYGPGEPTVEFERLRMIAEYARQLGGSQVTGEIQTNGVFGEDVAHWLSANIDNIWVSSDGPPDIQDANRLTVSQERTSATLAENLRFLCDRGHGVTGVRATITAATIRRQLELVEYFAGLGVRYIWSDPLFAAVGEVPDYRRFDFVEYAKEFLRAREHAAAMGVFYGSFLACNFDGDTDRHCRACVPVPHLTTDGYVSACDMALFGELLPGEKHMEQFIYGRWNEAERRIDYDDSRIQELRSRRAQNMSGCTGCSVLYRCAGYCLGEVANECGHMFGRKSVVCAAIRYLYERMAPGLQPYPCLHP